MFNTNYQTKMFSNDKMNFREALSTKDLVRIMNIVINTQDDSKIIEIVKICCLLNCCDNNGMTLLHYFAKNGKIEVLKLVQSEISLENYLYITDNNGNNILHFAALSGQLSLIQHFTNKHSLINAMNCELLQPIHIAAMNGDIALVYNLLCHEKYFVLFIVSLFHFVMQNNQTKLIHLLLEYQNIYDLCMNTDSHKNILCCLIKQNYIEVLNVCFEFNETFIYWIDLNGNNLLHYSSKYNKPEMIHTLKELIFCCNNNNETILHIASLYNSYEFMKEILINYNYEFNLIYKIKNYNEKEYFMKYVIKYNNINILKLFINNINNTIKVLYLQNENKRTILHFAVKYNRLNIIKLLQTNEKLLHLLDCDGRIFLFIAIKYERINIFKEIIFSNELLLIIDKFNMNILHYAIKQQISIEIIQLLLQNELLLNSIYESNENQINYYNLLEYCIYMNISEEIMNIIFQSEPRFVLEDYPHSNIGLVLRSKSFPKRLIQTNHIIIQYLNIFFDLSFLQINNILKYLIQYNNINYQIIIKRYFDITKYNNNNLNELKINTQTELIEANNNNKNEIITKCNEIQYIIENRLIDKLQNICIRSISIGIKNINKIFNENLRNKNERYECFESIQQFNHTVRCLSHCEGPYGEDMNLIWFDINRSDRMFTNNSKEFIKKIMNGEISEYRRLL